MNGHYMKRGRNQRRRQGVNPNRALDSNGPDVRIRGTAQQIYDKYQALARDAASSGDRVKAENYLQHAEHYFRVLRSLQGPQQQQPYDQSSSDADVDGDQPSIGEPREQRQNAGNGDDDGESNDAAETSENAAETEKSARRKTAGADENNGADNDGEAKPRRRRRPRRPREENSGEAEDQPDATPAS
ncbi:MAG: DUF4167 domain-containing protein [Parvularculaceae bacterium]